MYYIIYCVIYRLLSTKPLNPKASTYLQVPNFNSCLLSNIRGSIGLMGLISTAFLFRTLQLELVNAVTPIVGVLPGKSYRVLQEWSDLTASALLLQPTGLGAGLVCFIRSSNTMHRPTRAGMVRDSVLVTLSTNLYSTASYGISPKVQPNTSARSL